MSDRQLAMGVADSISYTTPARRQHREPVRLGPIWTAAGWLTVALIALAYLAAMR